MINKWAIIIPIVTFLLGAIIGTGSLWEYNKLKLEKYKQEKELRTEIENGFYKIIALTAKYIDTSKEAEKDNNTAKIQEANRISAQLDIVRGNIVAFEKILASLEKREPRVLDLGYATPAAPIDMRVR
jgi:hypothetical protein